MKKIISLLLIALLTFGCAPKDNLKLSTNKSVSNSEVQIQTKLIGVTGDNSYALVDSKSLPYLYDNFRSVLNNQGLVKWDKRFDCNHFASLYIATSQIKFLTLNWLSSTKVDTLALCEVWYKPKDANGGSHAIVAAYTEVGVIFIEPQNGQILNLTQEELSTIYFCKW